eukprot:CAMPEP_0201663618 /NCGR_PEP_ID=MMETSP0494-20130426/5355_1 /ASSEMBLY_ACC=CAM_ASM_000839 /TAXON_ID=420259 /ORGANISM="Thalassiosira gravida, Strain GMp14c1" /LENGTH=56 /DNA_ID=CAMNT_0048142247 /DNA_START=24 /DNA_END=190 /DNA_ORIENTATION=+
MTEYDALQLSKKEESFVTTRSTESGTDAINVILSVEENNSNGKEGEPSSSSSSSSS